MKEIDGKNEKHLDHLLPGEYYLRAIEQMMQCAARVRVTEEVFNHRYFNVPSDP